MQQSLLLLMPVMVDKPRLQQTAAIDSFIELGVGLKSGGLEFAVVVCYDLNSKMIAEVVVADFRHFLQLFSFLMILIWLYVRK